MARGKESGAATVLVAVPMNGQSLPGDLGVPSDAHGIVLFAHGSGSSRHSRRNQFVARTLERRQLATLDDVFVRYAGTLIESGGTYRDVSRTRRTARRVG
jgi:hypothetical protein